MMFLALTFDRNPVNLRVIYIVRFCKKNAHNSDNDFIPVLFLAALVMQPKYETVPTCEVLP
jgi:hypothetical protein